MAHSERAAHVATPRRLATLLIAVPLWRLGGWAFVASAGVLVGAWSGLRWAGVLQSRSVPSASPPDQTAAPQPRF